MNQAKVLSALLTMCRRHKILVEKI